MVVIKLDATRRPPQAFQDWKGRPDFMNAIETLSVPSLRDLVSPQEWETRVDLAACYRLVAHFGWSDLVFTHISARIPGVDAQFLINPYGMMFDEVTASSLVKIDQSGNKLDNSPFPVNPAGFLIHSAVHSARHDVHCVLHVHSLNGVAVSAQKEGVLPLSQQAMFVLSSIAYHQYEGVALHDEEKARLITDLGSKSFFMLRNHGLLTVGQTIADAFLAMYIFEAACTIQVRALAGNKELVSIDSALIRTAQEQSRVVTGSLGGRLAWPGLLRKLDRIDDSYKT
jgi:ribulose-5-phosphate 4-epimerase/fuculose-1-phosphate aldolase